MKYISLWEPWASLVGRGKTIETRSWPTSYRGWIAIQAAKKWDGKNKNMAGMPFFYSRLRETFLIGRKWHFPLGHIVSVAKIHSCWPTQSVFTGHSARETDEERTFGDYSFGRWAWVLEDIQPLLEPIPFRAFQGLKDLPADTERKIRKQVRLD